MCGAKKKRQPDIPAGGKSPNHLARTTHYFLQYFDKLSNHQKVNNHAKAWYDFVIGNFRMKNAEPLVK